MFSDLVGEHRTETVPPEPHRLVTDVDAPLEQNILDLPQRQRIADVHNHHEADHLGRAVEITEGIAHRPRLRMPPARLGRDQGNPWAAFKLIRTGQIVWGLALGAAILFALSNAITLNKAKLVQNHDGPAFWEQYARASAMRDAVTKKGRGQNLGPSLVIEEDSLEKSL